MWFNHPQELTIARGRAPAGLGDQPPMAGWSEQHLFRLIAQVMPNAREVLRYLAHQEQWELPNDQVRDHFAHHSAHPIGPRREGGTLTSVDAVRKQVGPASHRPVVSDEKQRVCRLDPRIAQGLRGPSRPPTSVLNSCAGALDPEWLPRITAVDELLRGRERFLIDLRRP
jgi:hypothetical protein